MEIRCMRKAGELEMQVPPLAANWKISDKDEQWFLTHLEESGYTINYPLGNVSVKWEAAKFVDVYPQAVISYALVGGFCIINVLVLAIVSILAVALL